MMVLFLTSIARIVGWGGVFAIALLVFYEGIPGASRIPFITSIPVLSDVIAGRVATHAANEVERATAGLVAKSEADALKAQLEMERNYRQAAEYAASELMKRASAADILATQRQEALNAALEAASGFQRPTKDELEWLNKR